VAHLDLGSPSPITDMWQFKAEKAAPDVPAPVMRMDLVTRWRVSTRLRWHRWTRRRLPPETVQTKGHTMLDFEAEYAALKTWMARFETEFLTVWGKARAAAQAWPYWVPAIVLAAVAGHYV